MAFVSQNEFNHGTSFGVEIKYAAQANWFTNHGVYMKQELLRREGFPMPTNWFMDTLTVNPDLFDGPLDAYEYCKPKISRLMTNISDRLFAWGYFKEASHCVYWYKLEFQENEYPHWHVFFNQLTRLTKDQLSELRLLWKFGRSRFDHLDKTAHYAFKYAFKAPFKKFDESNMHEAVPPWFADMVGIKEGKPYTFDRARFFQRSKNFLLNHRAWLIAEGKSPTKYKVIEPREVKPSQSCSVPITVREKLRVTLSKAQIIAKDINGKYLKSYTIILPLKFSDFVEKYITPELLKDNVVSLRPHHYFIKDLPADCLLDHNKHKYIKIQWINQMTQNRAKRLRKHQFQIMALLSSEKLSASALPKTGLTTTRKQFSAHNKLLE